MPAPVPAERGGGLRVGRDSRTRAPGRFAPTRRLDESERVLGEEFCLIEKQLDVGARVLEGGADFAAVRPRKCAWSFRRSRRRRSASWASSSTQSVNSSGNGASSERAYTRPPRTSVKSESQSPNVIPASRAIVQPLADLVGVADLFTHSHRRDEREDCRVSDRDLRRLKHLRVTLEGVRLSRPRPRATGRQSGEGIVQADAKAELIEPPSQHQPAPAPVRRLGECLPATEASASNLEKRGEGRVRFLLPASQLPRSILERLSSATAEIFVGNRNEHPLQRTPAEVWPACAEGSRDAYREWRSQKVCAREAAFVFA